jgi:hypothetical protein
MRKVSCPVDSLPSRQSSSLSSTSQESSTRVCRRSSSHDIVPKGVVCLDFDGINFKHVTSNLALFTWLSQIYVILWPQIQTNVNNKSQGPPMPVKNSKHSNIPLQKGLVICYDLDLA